VEQRNSHWTDFHEILYFSVFRKSVEKVQVLLTRTRITGALREDQYIFLIMSRVVLRMRNVSVKTCRENQNTYFVFNNFFPRKSCRLRDNVEKY